MFAVLVIVLVKPVYALNPVVLDETISELYPVDSHMEILLDEDIKWTIDDVTREPLSSMFKADDNPIPWSEFYKNKRIWIRFHIEIPESNKASWYCGFWIGAKAIENETESFILNERGQYKLKQTRSGLFEIFKIEDNPGRYSYHMKIDVKSAFLPDQVSVISFRRIQQLLELRNNHFGLRCGIMVAIIFINLFFAIIARRPVYLLYVASLISFLLIMLISFGTGYSFFWGNVPWINKSEPIFNVILLFFFLLFYRYFVPTKKYAVLDKLTLLIICSSGFVGFSYFIFDYGTIEKILKYHQYAYILFFGLLHCIVLRKGGWKSGNFHMYFFTLAFLPLFVGTIYFLFTRHLLFGGLFVEATHLLFTTAIFVDFRQIQREKQRIQKEATETLALKVDERTHELKEKNTILQDIESKLTKYLPKQLVESITSARKEVIPETERRKLTVFFSDIKGFTDLTESLEAEELSTLLNEYLTEMTNIAHKWGGTVDKFIGDAIMIFYGAPETTPDKDNALNCVKMAVEMQERMKSLQEKWFNEGIENPLQIRIGISTGTATVGNFGAEDRLSYTVIGGQVNIASRLESICEPDRVLISHPTWALVKDEIECSPREKVRVKGIQREMMTYDVVMGGIAV